MPAGVSAWKPLANITLSGSPTTVTFSGINQGFRDLVILGSVTGNTTGTVYFRFNGDTTNGNYSNNSLGGNGSSIFAAVANSSNSISFTAGGAGYIGNSNFSSLTVSINDYSTTNNLKSLIGRIDNPLYGSAAVTGTWNSTAAISSVSILAFNFAAGTTLALYGVSA